MAVRTAAEAKTAAYIMYDKSQSGDVDVEGELRLGFVRVLFGTRYAFSIEAGCVVGGYVRYLYVSKHKKSKEGKQVETCSLLSPAKGPPLTTSSSPKVSVSSLTSRAGGALR